jgi:uncharacterized protein
MSDRFVSDPHDVVKSGQVVRVKVMEVDLPRQRIGLSLRLTDEIGGTAAASAPRGGSGGQGARNRQKTGAGPRKGAQSSAPAAATGSMADALRKAGFGK